MFVASPGSVPNRPRAASPLEAEAIVLEAIAALDQLEPLIGEETERMRAGRFKAALELGDDKAVASLRYQRALDDIKVNAVALGRFQPAALDELKARHEVFAQALALNMAVLATARTVSESLVRELAADMGRAHNPQGYGASGQQTGAYSAAAAPLSVTRSA
jgi:hypothetical protein